MSVLPNTSGTGKERLFIDVRFSVSFLQNASIRTKILSLILPLCIVGLGATAFMSNRYKEADTAYSFSLSTTMPRWWSLPVPTAI